MFIYYIIIIKSNVFSSLKAGDVIVGLVNAEDRCENFNRV